MGAGAKAQFDLEKYRFNARAVVGFSPAGLAQLRVNELSGDASRWDETFQLWHRSASPAVLLFRDKDYPGTPDDLTQFVVHMNAKDGLQDWGIEIQRLKNEGPNPIRHTVSCR